MILSRLTPALGLGSVPALSAWAQAQVVIVDNSDAEFATAGTGWFASANVGAVGANSLLNASGTGTATATWAPDLPSAGLYDVYAWWVPSGNRTVAAPFTVTHAGGTSTVLANQEGDGDHWNFLGRWEFAAGTGGNVSVSDAIPEAGLGDPGNHFVSADAVRFEFAGGAAPAANAALVSAGSLEPCNLCSASVLPGALEPHPESTYLIVSDMPEAFGYPSSGPTTRSDGILYTTSGTLPSYEGTNAAPYDVQVNSGFTTIDDDFDIFLFHIAQPGDTSAPRRIVIYARNEGANSVDVTPDQVLVTDGVIGNVHEMESNLAEDFIEGNFDATGLGTVSIAPGAGEVIGFSKKFALLGNGTFKSQNINCFGKLRGTVAGVDPDLTLYIVAIDTTNTDVAPNVATMKSEAESLIAGNIGAPELESFAFNTSPTGCTLRRSTGVYPHEVWRSNFDFDLNTLPGGATFQIGLDDVRTDGCPDMSQTSEALLAPLYLRQESIGNYMMDYRLEVRVQNSDAVAREFDLQFGNTAADIGLAWQVTTNTLSAADAFVDIMPVTTRWAGPNQANLTESFLAAPFSLNPGEVAFVNLRFQILGNSSTPFQIAIPDTRGPAFDRVVATPATIGASEATTLGFLASETPAANPAVTVNGGAAAFSSASHPNYSYTFTTGATPANGPATLVLSGQDALANAGEDTDTSALTISTNARIRGDWEVLE
ncbi:MAG: hypothetical protein RLY93_04605 [Sumerlaeia bacterium]